jgi:Phage capsid family
MGSSNNFFRTASLGSIDREARTVELSFSSENPVRRNDSKYGGDYLEVLSHDEDDIDLYRLQTGAAPLLLDHDRTKQIGAVQSVRIENGKGYAVVKFGTSPLAEQTWNDVCAGIKSNSSVGYNLDEIVGESTLDGTRCLRFAWEPFEISIVSVPADPQVGIGRSHVQVTQPALTETERQKIILETRKTFMDTNFPETQNRGLELPEKDRQRYSITRAIRMRLEDKTLNGIEGELDQELSRSMRGIDRGGGFVVPDFILREPRQRDATVGAFGTGGALVQTSVPSISEWIQLLRNRTIFEAMGAKVIRGLSGNLFLPRQTGSTPQVFSGEQTQSTIGTQAVDGLLFTPKKISATTNISMQLLKQNPDSDEFVRQDLMAAINQKVDSACLIGQGGGEPIGVLNTTGVGSLEYGGTVTWTQVTYQDQVLAQNNIYGRKGLNNYGLVLGPKSFARWSTVPKIGTTGAASPNFILEKITPETGRCNGFPTIASNQVLNELSFQGCFSDCIVVQFGGYELIFDPFTSGETGTVKITVHYFGDFSLTVPQSWIVSMDPANQ